MTALKPDVKPPDTLHTVRDTNIARNHLAKLSAMLDISATTSNLDVTATIHIPAPISKKEVLI